MPVGTLETLLFSTSAQKSLPPFCELCAHTLITIRVLVFVFPAQLGSRIVTSPVTLSLIVCIFV